MMGKIMDNFNNLCPWYEKELHNDYTDRYKTFESKKNPVIFAEFPKKKPFYSIYKNKKQQANVVCCSF